MKRVQHTADNHVAEDHLLDALTKAHDGDTFHEPIFYRLWLPKTHSYYFLFKKNLRVTNMPHGELLALLRSYISQKPDPSPLKNLQFVSSREFKASMSSLIESFSVTKENKTEDLSKVAHAYCRILAYTVVVDSFFGSCVVSLPSHLSLDVESVCGKSGYVHSCGHYIYVRNIGKATKEEFFEELRDYLHPLKESGQKAFFAAYAHEDFTEYDRDKASELRNGLDDVKIFVEKCYLGSERLVKVLKQMKTTFADCLEMPEAGNFEIMHRPALRSKKVIPGRTIWLMVDQSIDDINLRHPGDEILLVCYEQMYINQNQFHIFDENKPAWVAHTTIPHTLAGAMISITKPYWPEKGPVVIGDPFSGSGTVCLEAAKFRNTKIIGGDIDPMGPQLLQDNLQFMWPDVRELRRTISGLRRYGARDTSRSAKSHSALSERTFVMIYQSLKMASRYDTIARDAGPSALANQADQIKALPSDKRLAFYVALRAVRRHAAAYERTKRRWDSSLRAFVKEATQLREQLERLLTLYESEEVHHSGHSNIVKGTYSRSCIVGFPAAYGDKKGSQIEYKVQSATNDDGRVFDVIITDPPYGINTSEPPDKLANLYGAALDRAIRCLKPNGQLVVCLPDETRTGQRVPYFTQKQVVVMQVMQLAHLHRREAIMASYSVPRITSLYRPPYYWDSDRSLRRLILHFRFRVRRDA